MDRQFFTTSKYVDQVNHVSAIEKTIRGRTDFHVHEFFEIEFVVGGSGKHLINESEYDIRVGSTYFIAPGTFHRIVCTPELNIVTIMFDETVLSNLLVPKLFEDTSDYYLSLGKDELDEIYALAKILINNLKIQDEYTNLFINNIINCIIVKIVRDKNQNVTKQPTERYAALNDALRYLYNNFMDNPTLNKLARITGYSPNYFSKIFTEYTGKSFVDFLNSLKISRAKMLLSSGNKSVSEIAFDCGFSSLSNFYRVFRDHTGLKPLEYRKKLTCTPRK